MLILADLGHDPKDWPSEAATAADKAFLVSPRNHRWRRVAVKPDINENLPYDIIEDCTINITHLVPNGQSFGVKACLQLSRSCRHRKIVITKKRQSPHEASPRQQE